MYVYKGKSTYVVRVFIHKYDLERTQQRRRRRCRRRRRRRFS